MAKNEISLALLAIVVATTTIASSLKLAKVRIDQTIVFALQTQLFLQTQKLCAALFWLHLLTFSGLIPIRNHEAPIAANFWFKTLI